MRSIVERRRLQLMPATRFQVVWNVPFSVFVLSVIRLGVRGDVALQQDPNFPAEQATGDSCP